MAEIWRAAKYVTRKNELIDFSGKYEVSNLGNVRSLRFRMGKNRVKNLKQHSATGGYLTVEFSGGTKKIGSRYRCACFVHRLVAYTFPEICGEWFPGAEVNHKNETTNDNKAENLEWLTPTENINYGSRKERCLATKQKNGKRNIPVVQYTLSGEPIKEWPSATIAAAELGLNRRAQGHISTCCTGKRKNAYGYIWKHRS